MKELIQKLLKDGKITQDEAKELERYSTKLEELEQKYSDLEKTYNEVNSSKTSLEEKLSDIETKLQKAKEEGKKELISELEAEKQKQNELLDKLQTLQTTTKNLKIENSLNKVLAEYEVIDKDLIADVLKQKVEFKDDNLLLSGKSLEDGVKEFFESKPHLLKPKGNEGSGSGSSNTGFSENSLTAKLLNKLR